MAGISTLTSTFTAKATWSGTNNQTGAAYTGNNASSTITKNYALGTKVANGASGGADEIFSFQQAITGGGSATLDLTAMTNQLQQAAVNIVRIKAIMLQLLNTTDDSTITTPAASSVTVTNNGPTLPVEFDFGSNGSGLTLNLTTGAGALTSVAINAAGSGYPPSSTFLVTPNQTGGSGGVVAVTTNASGVPTTVAVVAGAGGSGYSNASAIPTTELGSYTLFAGSVHQYFDVSAAGFCPLDSLHKNIKIFNNDAANTATVQITIAGATT